MEYSRKHPLRCSAAGAFRAGSRPGGGRDLAWATEQCVRAQTGGSKRCKWHRASRAERPTVLFDHSVIPNSSGRVSTQQCTHAPRTPRPRAGAAQGRPAEPSASRASPIRGRMRTMMTMLRGWRLRQPRPSHRARQRAAPRLTAPLGTPPLRPAPLGPAAAAAAAAARAAHLGREACSACTDPPPSGTPAPAACPGPTVASRRKS
jgi:hypothetical protein